MTGLRPPIPPSYIAKKNAILAYLSTPESTYKDLSPKGSLDEAIKPLIDRINALEGIVTTSSCAGRVSVFLEGHKKNASMSERLKYAEGGGGGRQQGRQQAAVPGGKGMGGKWLFVSHEPVLFKTPPSSFATHLGMRRYIENCDYKANVDISKLRFARFQFEPMILHIMCASLHHARPILAAAINAGFRESGVQSLKNLDDPNAFPMVAIRSSGLALEAVVGSILEGPQSDGNEQDEGDDEVEYELDGLNSMVSEDYLHVLIKLANERFRTNTERIQRFEEDLFRKEAGPQVGWEDSKSRQEKKRMEGLQRQEFLRREKNLG